jgi:recombination protein RecA
VDLATDRGILEKSGAHYALDGERIAQGRERAAEWLRANPEAYQRVAERLRTAYAEASQVPPPMPDEEAA